MRDSDSRDDIFAAAVNSLEKNFRRLESPNLEIVSSEVFLARPRKTFKTSKDALINVSFNDTANLLLIVFFRV